MHIYLYSFSEPLNIDDLLGIVRIGNCPHLGHIQDPEVFVMLDEFLDELRKRDVFTDYFTDFFWSREHVSLLADMIDHKIEELTILAEADAKKGKKRKEYPLWQLQQQKDPIQTNHLTQIVREAKSKDAGLIGLCD